MDQDILKAFLGSLVRHALTAAGLYVGLDAEGQAKFVGAGMVIAGLLWSWWQKSGQAQTLALLKKLTASHNTTEAVTVAKAMPTPTTKEVNSQIVSQVVKVLLVAFALSFLLAGHSAFAQTRTQPQIKLPIDPLHLNGTPVTGDPNKDLMALWQKIITANNADLTYASALAGSANSASSKVRKQCWDAIIALNVQATGSTLKNADGSPMAKPDAHVFTDVESLAEVLDNLSPQGALFTNCAGAAELAKKDALQFISAVVTGAAGLAALPAGVIP